MADSQPPHGRDGKPPGTPFEPRRAGKGKTDAEPDPDLRRRAVRTGYAFTIALVITAGLSVLAPPWPLPVVAALAAIGSVVLGILTLIRLRAARLGGLLTGTTVAGIILALFLSLGGITQVIFWREYSAYAECSRSALTQRAELQCRAQLDRELDERMDELQRSVTP